MAPGSSSFQVISIFIISFCFPLTQCCQVHLCSNEYSSLFAGHQKLQKLEMRDIKPRLSDRLEYCNLLEAYNQCLKSLSRSCRGKLDYHAVLVLVRKWIDENQCPKHDLPGLNFRSRQGIRSGTLITSLSSQSSSYSHQTHGDQDRHSNEDEGNTREEDGVNNSDDITASININQEPTEVRRRGKSHHPQCILYAPSTSSSGRRNYYSLNVMLILSIILSVTHEIFSCR